MVVGFEQLERPLNTSTVDTEDSRMKTVLVVQALHDDAPWTLHWAHPLMLLLWNVTSRLPY